MEPFVKPPIAPLQKKIAGPLKQTAELPKLAVKKLAEVAGTLFAAKEIGKQNYVLIGNYYVQKKLIAILALVLLALVCLIWIKPPNFVYRMFGWVPVIHEQAGTALTYTGKAKVYDTEGRFKYEGALTDGIFQGAGKLYDPEGRLKLQGNLIKDSSKPVRI
ncbi:hypothetical protein LJK88_26815 [Paenibacillus sp. P26]|nr:hypothetical protein LJK88_26815 [Paenibacillus sp. P26]UUZ95012.1 hypothetical protein LJK87_11175 [Paenibacillus sp. P25]